jgi:hypothetical protein
METTTETGFELEADEAQLLEEFGVLMYWEYNTGT